jgi:hypothetical protein
MTQPNQAGIDFGSQVCDLAFEQDLDYTAIFTGLAVAVSAMLVDYVANEDGTVDDMSLKYAITNFTTGMNKAVEFAVAALAKDAV